MSGTSISSDYEYMDENDIDAGLKCVICMQPLQSPVSLSNCHHIFCQECIETWFTRSHTCPTCRRHPVRRIRDHNRLLVTPPFIPLSNQIVIHQLDRLLVRCSFCKTDNMQRRHWRSHEKTCSKRTMNYPWQESLPEHLDTCALQQVRPLVVELKNELATTQTAYNQLKHSVDQLERKVGLLLKHLNNGTCMMEHGSK